MPPPQPSPPYAARGGRGKKRAVRGRDRPGSCPRRPGRFSRRLSLPSAGRIDGPAPAALDHIGFEAAFGGGGADDGASVGNTDGGGGGEVGQPFGEFERDLELAEIFTDYAEGDAASDFVAHAKALTDSVAICKTLQARPAGRRAMAGEPVQRRGVAALHLSCYPLADSAASPPAGASNTCHCNATIIY